MTFIPSCGSLLTFQHDLTSLSLVSSTIETKLDLRDLVYSIRRIAMFIYREFVIFPSAQPFGVKPALAKELRLALTALYDAHGAVSDKYSGLIVWAIVIGGIGSAGTSDRLWYRQQFYDHVTADTVSWIEFKRRMLMFLWWDYVFEDLVTSLWTEAHYYKQGTCLELKEL